MTSDLGKAVVLQESVAELLALVDGARNGTGQTAARTAPPARAFASKPVKSSVAGVKRPLILAHPAATNRSQEKLSFADVPAKASTNGHYKGETPTAHRATAAPSVFASQANTAAR
jgi:hypothetical protein